MDGRNKELAKSLESANTPAGIQSRIVLFRRRLLVTSLNVSSFLVLLLWLASILGASGWSPIDLAIFACFAITVPWIILNMWNAFIGVWLLHGSHYGIPSVTPLTAAADTPTPMTVRTAVLMTIRNEDPARAFARLALVKASLDATGQGAAFFYFVLSDTSETNVAFAEEDAFAQWKSRESESSDRLFYRRRSTNEGFKAGNLHDFCERWGADYDFMLPLDADSLMLGSTILRMTRILHGYPRIGILQSLVVGAPSRSVFARIFQFGLRLGMRPYTIGSAWWAGDCGPFWGHNALVRIAPYAEHCHLPILPGGLPLGGQIMSHDQVEAALMRRAGYEVRDFPEESGSFEDNPPTLLEFIRRDLRWCQGNMQYLRLLGLRGLKPMSRFQLAWSFYMFIGVLARTVIIILLVIKPLDGEDTALFPAVSAASLYVLFILMYLAPKLSGFIDIVLTRNGVARYGGGRLFAISAVTETFFSLLLTPSVMLRTSLFIIELAFGRTVAWNGQSRDSHALSWGAASRSLWPQTVFGVVLMSVLVALAPRLIIWSLPLTIGYLVAIPFAIITSDPTLGGRLADLRLCATEEEFGSQESARRFF